MPGAYDEALRLVVQMKDEASKEIAKLRSAVTDLNKSLDSSSVASAKAGASSSKMSRIFAESEGASRRFGYGLLAAGTAASAFIGYGVKIAGDLEAARMGFVTLLGSAGEADRVMASIKKEAARTPFEIQGLTSATQLLSSVTKDGDKALKTVLDIGEGLAAMGKGQAELDRVAVNLQQIAAMGRAYSVDIKQFAYAGLPIYDMLAEKTGLAGKALAQFIEEGGVTFEMLASTFDKANDAGGRFFGAFKNQAGTFNQLYSNMKDSVNIFMADFVQQTGLFSAVKEALTSFTSVITAHKQDIIDFGEKGIGFITRNVPLLAGAITGALIPALVALISVGGGWVALLAVAGAATGYVAGKINEFATGAEQAAAASANYKTSIEALIQTEYKNIAALEVKKASFGTSGQAYIGMLQKESQANIAYDQLQKRLADAEATRMQREWDVRTSFFEKRAKNRLQEAVDVENALRQEATASKKALDEMANFRDKDMDAKVRLGEKEYANRVAMLDKAKIKEGSVRDEILAIAGNASQKEIKLAIDKANRQIQVTAQLRETLAKITAVPIIQQVQVAFNSPTSATKGSIFQSLGSVALKNTSQILKAGSDYRTEVEKLNAEFSKATAQANKLSGGLDKVGASGGGAGSGTDKAKEAAEKAKKEFEKMTEEVTKNWKAYGDMKTKIKEALTELETTHKEKVESITKSLKGLQGSLEELKRSLSIEESGTKRDIASAYLDQMKRVNEISTELDEERMKSWDEKSAEKIRDLQDQLLKEETALNAHKDIATTYATEIAEAQRRNGLTEFERFLEDIASRRQAMFDEYNTKRGILLEEIKDLTDQRIQEDTLFEAKKAALQRVQAAVKGFGLAWGNIMRDMTKVTQDRVNDMNKSLDSLKGRLELILSLQKQTSTGANFNAAIPGRAGGGSVTRGRGYVVGENGPEYFMPGRSGNIVPNEGIGGGGISVVINNPTVRNEDDIRALERIVDQALRKVFINNKI